MSGTQVAAFQAGSGVSASDLLLGIAAIFMTLLLIWGAWVALGQLQAWQQGRASLFDMLWTTFRAGMLLLLLGWFVR
jgi:integrating conjugative element protein (TIGR03758 family)